MTKLATEVRSFNDHAITFQTDGWFNATEAAAKFGKTPNEWLRLPSTVEYFDANSAVPLTAIKSEVQRYLVMPGQATAYKIGMIRIQELRKKAEAELGDKFDIKGFHDSVLGGGALPLTLLERRVDQWIASQKTKPAQ